MWRNWVMGRFGEGRRPACVSGIFNSSALAQTTSSGVSVVGYFLPIAIHSLLMKEGTAAKSSKLSPIRRMSTMCDARALELRGHDSKPKLCQQTLKKKLTRQKQNYRHSSNPEATLCLHNIQNHTC